MTDDFIAGLEAAARIATDAGDTARAEGIKKFVKPMASSIHRRKRKRKRGDGRGRGRWWPDEAENKRKTAGTPREQGTTGNKSSLSDGNGNT